MRILKQAEQWPLRVANPASAFPHHPSKLFQLGRATTPGSSEGHFPGPWLGNAEGDYNDSHRDLWNPGDTAHFEYHCLMDPESSDYHLWQRTQQPVRVVGKGGGDDFSAEMPTGAERGDEGVPLSYEVEFPDGHHDTVMEDELLTHPKHYLRQYAFLPENVGAQG